jgi:hypothetical protein
MRTFEVWADFYDDNEGGTFSTPTVNVQALTAKIAMAHGLQFIEPYLPDGLGISDITLVCQDAEEDHVIFEPDDGS